MVERPLGHCSCIRCIDAEQATAHAWWSGLWATARAWWSGLWATARAVSCGHFSNAERERSLMGMPSSAADPWEAAHTPTLHHAHPSQKQYNATQMCTCTHSQAASRTSISETIQPHANVHMHTHSCPRPVDAGPHRRQQGLSTIHLSASHR